MPITLKVRPSKLELTRACPGSVATQAPYPWEDSAAANRGRALHDCMALLFQTGEKAWAAINSNPEITDADKRKLPQVYEVGLAQMPDDPEVITLVERPLALEFLGMDGGKPDLVFISKKHKGAVIIDWKFGARPVEDPDQNAQMQAYGIGILALYPDLESIEGIIIQPWNDNPDDWYRSHTWPKAELRKIAEQDKELAFLAKKPNAPINAGPHCDHGFCSARKAGTSKEGAQLPACTSYADWRAGKAAVKAEVTATATAALTTQGDAVTVMPDEPLIAPVIVINAEAVALAKEKRALAQTITVTSNATAAIAGKLSKELRGLAKLIDTNRKAVAAPFYAMFKKINASAETALSELEAGAKFLDGQADNWVKAEAERERKERQAQEDAKRAAEQAAMAAERAELEAQRAAQEATRRQMEAEQAALAAKGKKAKAEAEAAAAKARAEAEAAEAQRRAEEEKRLQAERDERIAKSNAEAIAPAAKVEGYRTAIEITSTVPDLTKVPKQWIAAVLVVDQKALDALVKQGKLNETNAAAWLEIKRETVAVRSR